MKTKEMLLDEYSMSDVVNLLGFKMNRNGMISCPFHGQDKHPSMKIYPNRYVCFTCGATGDIFDMVKEVRGYSSFKDAYMFLGGEYKKQSKAESRRIRIERRINKTLSLTKEVVLKAVQSLYIEAIETIRTSAPFSDAWCDGINAYEINMYRSECLRSSDWKKDLQKIQAELKIRVMV